MAGAAVTMKQLVEINEKKELTLNFHRYQTQTYLSRSHHTMALKGWRAGYSSIGPWWMLRTIKACGPGNRATNYLCLTPTIQGARKGLMGYMQSVFCDILEYGKMSQSPVPKIELNKRAEIEIFGHAQREPTEIMFGFAEDPNSFASMTCPAILADEIGQKQFKYESWGVAKARLSTYSAHVSAVDGLPMGRWLGGTTVYTLGWVEDEFNEYKAAVWQKWHELYDQLRQTPQPDERRELKADFKDKLLYGGLHRRLHFVRFDSTRNPIFNKQDLADARITSPEWFVQMRYCARFRKPAGTIYESWEPGRHVVEPFKTGIPSSWPREVAIDPGKRNFHATFWAWDQDRDRHFLYDSYHDAQKSNEERARDILAKEPNLSWGVAGQISEEDVRVELAQGGLVTVAPAYKSLWDGINACASAVKQDKVFVIKGACPGFESQMRNYSRPVDAFGGVLLDEDPEDKEIYHWLDGFRYRGTWRHSAMASRSAGVQAGREREALAVPSIMAGGSDDKLMLPTQMPVGVMAGGVFGHGLSVEGQYRAQRYGLDAGCSEPWLD